MTQPRLTDAMVSDDPKTKTWKVRFACAKGAYDLGKFSECESLLHRLMEQANTLQESVFATNTCHVGLGAVYVATGKIDKAKHHLEIAINSLSGTFDESLKELSALAHRFYAEALREAGDEVGAEHELEQAVHILTELGVNCVVPLAYAMSDLAALYVTQAKLKDAKKLILSSMELLRQSVGAENQEYIRASMISNICDSAGEEEMLQQIDAGISKLQYYFGKHPSLTRAIRWYRKKCQERGETDNIDGIENGFVHASGDL